MISFVYTLLFNGGIQIILASQNEFGAFPFSYLLSSGTEQLGRTLPVQLSGDWPFGWGYL